MTPVTFNRLALLAGPLLAAIVYKLLPLEFVDAAGLLQPLSPAARGTLALAACMATWWLSEALPVSATALVPIALFPVLGLDRLDAVAAAYAHPLIFLFFGGFLLSIAIEKWGLHRWMAHRVVAAAHGDARRLVGGFMLVTAFASMWLSNTATTVMMLPIASSAIAEFERGADRAAADRFAPCLLLAIAYAASVGGMGTLIGSPPNLFVAGFLAERYGYVLDFRAWMLTALPLVAVLLPLVWWLLTRVLTPIAAELPAVSAAARTPWRELPRGARRVAAVFGIAVVAWILRDQLNALTIAGVAPLAALTDTGVAMLAGLALFIVADGAGDGGRLMDWHDAERLPIGTLLLFGGGLALAGTISATGADQFIGAQLAGLRDVPAWVVTVVVIAAVVFLTELTSNIATTTTLTPILAVAAASSGLDVVAVVVATALSASAAFMLPVATPPNAIVFASGRLAARTMARTGIWINLVAISLLSVLALLWLPYALPALGAP
ncbi:MAG: SLC13/DASS family transporter [Gammaproteobacteria bacterium]|nr:SLC13/DASS family transporter [Gammaproteobacteria bacterium]